MMKGIVKSEFQLSATPDEHMSRHLAYLAAQDSGSVLTGGFVKDRAGFESGDDSSDKQTARAIEFLTQQEQIRQQRTAELASRLDALELAARDALMAAENDLGDILSNANRDRLGRAVFMDEGGQLRDEDGVVIDPETIDMSEWDSTASSWERFNNTVERRDAAYDSLQSVEELRERWDSRDPETIDFEAWDAEMAEVEGQLDSLNGTAKEPTSAQPTSTEPSETAPSQPLPGLGR